MNGEQDAAIGAKPPQNAGTEASGEARPPVADRYAAGREQYRETLKWMMTSFGAIGAALALGGLLSNLGQSTGARLALGIVGGLLAFAGVFVALWLAVKILTSSHMSIGELGEESRKNREDPGAKVSFLVGFFEKENPQVLGKFNTLEELASSYLKAAKSGSVPGGAQKMVRQVVDIASFEQLRDAFNRGITRIIGSLAVTALGVLLFAAVVQPAEEEEDPVPVVVGAPVVVEVSLTRNGRELLADDLGEDCVANDVAAIALEEETNGELDVVSQSTDDCAVVRFAVSDEVGLWTPVDESGILPSILP